MLEDIIAERKRKLARLKEAGVDPYPARAKRTLAIAQARKGFAGLARSRRKIFVAGRIMGLRDQGGLIFLDLMDDSGSLQVLLKKKDLKNFSLLKQTLDIGDIVSVGGPLFKTKKGEQSVEAKEVAILAKSILPLPSGHYSVEDIEILLRQRYLDLMLHPEERELFRKKALFWESVRELLKKEGFLEVEMSALEPLPGGAEAEPFMTHHNALDTDFYLRISLELPLKKLLVGGFEKVFEIGRVFRNEGIDREHLQDYMQLEFYWAYHDYNDLMKLVERLYKAVVRKTCGGLTTVWQGQKIQWGRKWPKVEYASAFRQATGLDPLEASEADLRAKAKELKLDARGARDKGRLIDLIYKKAVRPKLIQPSFLVHHPVSISPLAKRSPKDPRVTERVQLLACGTELGNGWSELNDPLDQRARFEEQEKARAAGDKEAQRLDEEFLTALKYGMPPAAGWGLSERLFAVLMDRPIRETVFFPLMKSKR